MNTQRNLSKYLFVALLIVLTLPLVFAFIPTSRGKALFGITASEKLDGSIWRILDHSFQQKAEQSFKHTVGFCNHAVRLNNEINYRLFHYSSAPKLILGKDDYFFEDIYLKEYTGQDYVGEAIILDNVQHFKKLQDSLAQKGTTLLLVIEPSKAWYMPERLPERCCKGQHTNYESYRKVCQQLHVKFLDLNEYFIQNRQTSPYPLYSKHGIHWSSYGTWLAATQLQQFIEQAIGKSLGTIQHLGDSTSNVTNDLDFDLEPPMNLLRPLKHETLGFPILQMLPAENQPTARIIADSYVWSLWDKGFLHQWFHAPEFWYYNNTVYPNIWAPGAVNVTEEQHLHTFDNKDIILLMTTTANLKDFGWGL